MQSFNPMCDPSDDWDCKFDVSPQLDHSGVSINTDEIHPGALHEEQKDFSFSCEPSVSEEDDELTESKIQAFLDEKVLLFVEIKLVHLQSSFSYIYFPLKLPSY